MLLPPTGTVRDRHRCATPVLLGVIGKGLPPGCWRSSRSRPQPGAVCSPAPRVSRHGLQGLFWLLESCANTGVSLSSPLTTCDARPPSAELPAPCVQRPPAPACPPASRPTHLLWGKLAVRMRGQQRECLRVGGRRLYSLAGRERLSTSVLSGGPAGLV